MVENSIKSAYIHIPFCKSKCNYCSFVSGVDFDKKTAYIYSLLKEIEYYYDGTPLETLYIGGGTPSVLSVEELSKIFKKFKLEPFAEITIELNPNDITPDYLSGLKELGINRISIGAQSFDNSILKLIGRRHSEKEIYKAVESAKNAGFSNISLDLIYGLPLQTVKGFEKDLTEALNLEIQHLSLYGLKISSGCYFYENPPSDLPDDDIQADMYILAGELTSKWGYKHYEISNYSKPDFYSKHNTNYWKCGSYYGFGLSAHGYTGDMRYSNTEVLKEYLDSPVSHEYGKFLTKQEKLEERIFLGLRLSEGININDINNEFNIDFDRKYASVINKYVSGGYLVKTDKGYAFSDSKDTNGFLLSNIILADFIE